MSPSWDSYKTPLEFLYRSEEEGSDPRENFDRFIAHLRARIRQRWQNVIVVDGRTGVGKSSGGVDLAIGVEPNWDVGHTAFSSEDALRQWRGLARGQVLLYDEGVLGLLSQGGRRNDELTRLVQALSIIRAKGITTIVCIPSIWMLDSFAREGLADFWIHLRQRGRGRVYGSWQGARYRRPNRLPYDELRRYTPIGFENVERTHRKLWAAYYQRKMGAIEGFLSRSEVDPTGKITRCPRCGKTMTRWNLAIHRCPGNPGAEAAVLAALPPSGGASGTT